MRTYSTFNKAYQEIIEDLLVNGKPSSPRGSKTLEIVNYNFTISNPSLALCTIKERKLNYAFSIIEKMEYATGQSDSERICFYNSNMKNFTNKEGTFDGAYGPRINNNLDGQLKYVYELLKKDPDTRQAIITIHNNDDRQPSKDIPCTLNFQFLLRDGFLHMIATMRSNDILWGTPYDVSGFTFIQQLLASWLDVNLGLYHHKVGSMHLYTNTLDKLIDTKNGFGDSEKYHLMEPITGTYDQFREHSKRFWEIEDYFRREKPDWDKYKNEYLPEYMKIYLEEIRQYIERKLTK